VSDVTIAAHRQHRLAGPQAETLDSLERLRLHGPITAATSRRVRQLFQEHADHEAGLLVDLQGVTALDATGVAALLEAQRAVRREHGVMVLRPNQIVSDALRHSGTISAFVLWNG
jgi:anti-anti-sigma factor